MKSNTEISDNISELVSTKPTTDNPAAKRLVTIHTLQDELTSSPQSHDVLELAMATVASVSLSKQNGTALLWLLIVGAPGSDKTNTIRLIEDRLFNGKSIHDDDCSIYFLDKLTENSFASGYVDNDKRKAPSLLPLLDGKCCVIKDLTTLFSMREDKIKTILGDLQSIYDGTFGKFTGTLGLLQFDSLFSMVGCITPQALDHHHRYMSLIGSRFLYYRLRPLSDEECKEGLMKNRKTGDRKSKEADLQRLVIGHVKQLLSHPLVSCQETPEQQEIIDTLAMVLARGRAVITYTSYQYIRHFQYLS